MTDFLIRTLLDQATQRLAGLPTARRDAELLLLHVLGRDRAWLITHSDETLTAAQAATYHGWLARRAAQEPVQYIVGEQEFWGLRLRVTADVLIPRPETEHLVEAALELLPEGEAVRVADIGTGSGAIAIALAVSRPRAQVTALDLSAAALQIARENAALHGVAERVRLVESDLLAAVRGERFAMIVSNPPYVPGGEDLEPQVRDFEPHTALFAGAEGLDVYKRLIPEAAEALEPGGWLLMEIGHGQRAALAELLRGWDEVRFVDDLQGIPRVAVAKRR
jgi:release factor glutamine methyltransferase